jgi:autotransporter-associated beta strand protein
MKLLVQILPALCALSLAPTAWAGTHIWSGAGANRNWSTAANWSSGEAPVAGEAAPVVLIFPANASNVITVPNVANLKVDSIQITSPSNVSYNVNDGGVTVNLTGAGAVDLSVKSPGGGLVWTAAIRLEANCLFENAGNSTMDIRGVVSGPGGITKIGTSALRFSTGGSANTFTGTLRIEEGNLELAKISGTPCFGGKLEVVGGFCYIRQSHQIPNNASILLDDGSLQTFPDVIGATVADAIGPVTLINSGGIRVTGSNRIDLGGTVTVGAGSGFSYSSIKTLSPTAQLTLNGGTRIFNVTTERFYIDANIIDGGASGGIIKTGGGILDIQSATSFTGSVQVQEGTLAVGNSQSLGSTAGGTSVSPGATLQLGVDTPVVVPAGETLSLSGTLSCARDSEFAGPITLSGTVNFRADSGMRLTLSGVLSGSPASVHFTGGGFHRLSGSASNTFGSTTTVSGVGTLELAKSNALAIPGSLILNSGKVRLLASNQIHDSSTLLWGGVAELDLNNFFETIGYVRGDAAAFIRLGNGTLTMTGSSDAQLGSSSNRVTFSGSSVAKIRKLGAGKWTLWATPISILAERNTVLSIESGTVEIHGDWPGTIQSLGGLLHGSANVGMIQGIGGQVCLCDFKSGGFSGISPGTITVKMSGNTPGTGFDRMISSGPINLAGQTLLLSVPNFIPTTSAGYRIIVNNGSDHPGNLFRQARRKPRHRERISIHHHLQGRRRQ